MPTSSIAQQYWTNLPKGSKIKISKAAGITRVHAWAVFNGKGSVSPQTAVSISKATRGKIIPEDFFAKGSILRIGIALGASVTYTAIDRELHTVSSIGLLPFNKEGWLDIKKFTKTIDLISHKHIIAFIGVPVSFPVEKIRLLAIQFEAMGALRALLYIRRVPVNWVTPYAWRIRAGLIKTDKVASIELAKTLYPDFCFDINKDFLEALLVAHFGI